MLLFGFAGATATRAEEVRGALQVKGSDTMVNLAQAWAEGFMAKYPDASIAVTGGGSGTGFAALISGTCDLAASSREMKPKEVKLAQAKGASPQEFKVALDGIAVVVHPDNPVKQLTVAQLADLFTGKVTNWKDAGGPDRKVVLLSREVNSGTHVYFKEHVLGQGQDGASQEFSSDALLLPSSQAIADEVAGNPAAIGYFGMGYLNNRNAAVSIAKTPGAPFVAPSEAAVQSGEYPISRPLYFYSRVAPGGLVKTFLDFVVSDEGQGIVRQNDFVPLPSAGAGS